MEQQEFIFRKIYLTVLSLIAATGFLAAFIAGVIASPNPSDIFGAVIITFLIYTLWLLGWRSAVRLNESGVTVDNLLVRHVIPWADLAHIEVSSGLQFRLRDGQNVGSLVYGGSLMGQILGHESTARVATKMESIRNQLRNGIRGSSPDCDQYSHKFHIILWEPLAILGTLEIFSISVLVIR